MMLFKRIACRSVQQELWDYAEERLPEGPMERVERHLENCSACRQEVESLRRAQNLLSTARQEAPTPAGFGWADLQRRLEAQGTSFSTMRPDAAETRRVMANLLPRRRFVLPELPRLALAGSGALTFALMLVGYQSFRVPHPSLEPRTTYVYLAAPPAAPAPVGNELNLAGIGNALPAASISVATAPVTAPKQVAEKPPVNGVAQPTAAQLPAAKPPVRVAQKDPQPNSQKIAVVVKPPKENKIEFTPHVPGPDERAQEADQTHNPMETIVPVTYDPDSVY